MKILQALFFPPDQPGGASSMVPYIQEHFTKQGGEMDLFFLPKRIRNKGKDKVPFVTLDVDTMKGSPIVDKYEQTIRDYLWWSELRIQKRYDLIHAHHPIAALVLKYLFPETPVMITLHSSYESELIL